MFPGHAGMRGFTGLMARISRFEGAVAALDGEQKVTLVDKLIARVVRHRVQPGVHSDGVARTSLDAVSAENAAQLVHHELYGEALVASPRVARRVLARLDVNALRGPRRGAAQARNAPHAGVLARRQPMNSAEALRVRALLLRIRNRGDTVVEALQNRVRALTAHHLARILENVLHRDADTAKYLGKISANLEPIRRMLDRRRVQRCGRLLRESSCGHENLSYACIGPVFVPPCLSSSSTEEPRRVCSCLIGAKMPMTPRATRYKIASATRPWVTSAATLRPLLTAGPALSSTNQTTPVMKMLPRERGRRIFHPSFISWS